MYRRQHRLPRPVLPAVSGLDPGTPVPVEQQAGDALAAQHGAAVTVQVPGQGLRQPTGSAGQDRPAALLTAEDKRIGEHPRTGHVDRLVGLERHPQHERPDMPAAELVPDDIPRGQRPPALPQPAPRMPGQPRVQRRTEADRGELRSAEDRLHLVVLIQQAKVRGGISGREPADLRRSAVPVQPHGELLAVRERDVSDRVGIDIAQPVIGDQPELVPGEQRVNPDQRMAGGAGIDAVARQQDLLRGGSASRHVPGIEHQAPVPGLRQVARGDQAVMPSPRHDNVRALIHGANVPGTRPAAQAAAPANRS